MKKLILLASILLIISIKSSAQVSLNKEDLVGVWQYNSARVGNGYGECFAFFKDGTFVYQYDPSDDTRNIIALKGRYELKDNSLVITVLSRTERLGGKIMAGAVGTDEFLFVFDNDKTKQITEIASKALDPFFISKVKNMSGKIDCYINNRHYYKVSSNASKINNQ